MTPREQMMLKVLAQNAANQTAALEAIVEGATAIVQAMNAPKEVVRDDNGRPVGIKPVEQLN